ncbi:MAG: hypothetical protein GC205_11330 [Bacteroidetes bacterium]|nr:hypothetical protein [Bacteroidota bacterium]
MLQEEKNQIDLGQQAENEIAKLRLAARFGTVLTGSQDLPGGLEARWLGQLEAVESKFAEATRTTVAAYLGNPKYPRESRLSDRKLSTELQRLSLQLEEAGIEVTTLYRVPPREFYRYLTEELMEETIENIRMEGINQQFVFEDFYPNEEFEVEHTVVEFFDMLFGKYYAMLESIMYLPEGELGDSPEMSAMVDRLCDFTDSFDEIELLDFELEEITMLGSKRAQARVRVSYIGYPNARGKGFTFSGPAHFTLHLDQYDYWAIEKVQMPGVYDPGAAA